MDDYMDLSRKDFFNGNAKKYMRNRLIDAGVKEGSYDDFGLDLEAATNTMTFFLNMYKFYFRVDVHGAENLPDEGKGLLASNHSPILPFDACMIVTSALVAPEKARYIRTIVNRGIAAMPFFSTLMYRTGQIIGCDENVKKTFENDNLILVFPTGAEGQVHTIFNKYHLDQFTIGFMEYALRYRTPIIPTCVIGSEEAAMTLGVLDLPIGGGFGHMPITPIFPWLGPLGLVPLPSKFDIYFEEPVDYFTDHADDVDDPAKVREIVDDLHSRIRAMLDNALDQ